MNGIWEFLIKAGLIWYIGIPIALTLIGVMVAIIIGAVDIFKEITKGVI